MAKSANQKLKVLYLLKMLEEKTDEENTMTINDMITELDRYGMTAERKSIYDDLEALRHYGISACNFRYSYLTTNNLIKVKMDDRYYLSKFIELNSAGKIRKVIKY